MAESYSVHLEDLEMAGQKRNALVTGANRGIGL
jgi:hypothetical protein